ncbi:MAG: Rrf2 family transcriptional regulator [Anaerolineales bacterium]|jgi:Rrf2 family protein|nr:Rrf2 family transcriptional regulator [Anaerolineales bacterium]
MFRVNRRTDYAIRVMLALAKHPSGWRMSTKEIQDSMRVPRAFLQRIIADLSKAELIETFPGPHGGIQLARGAERINLRHIWEAIEGPLLISECLQAPEDCPLSDGCPVNAHWQRMQMLMQDELEGTPLSQLACEAFQLDAG